MGRTEGDLMFPTPLSSDCNDGRMGKKSRGERVMSSKLPEFVKELQWRTPCAQESGICVNRLEGEIGSSMYDKETGRYAQYGLPQQVMWPSPRSGSDAMCGGSGHKGMLRSTELESGRSKLNPAWVEHLMGLPKNWTQLSSATDQAESRIDRLRLLGNGVVPQTAEKAFRTLLERLCK